MFVFLCVCVWEGGMQIFSGVFLLWFCTVIVVLSQGKATASVWYLCINLPICAFMSVCFSVSMTECHTPT